jgi:tetratricopeptide (TPR) repeat protein
MSRSARLAWAGLGLLTLLAAPPRVRAEEAAATGGAAGLEQQLAEVDRLLEAWQLTPARTLAERLLLEHPDLPGAQLAAAWVKFHQGEHAAARELAERAAAAFQGALERDPRLGLIRDTAQVTAGFRLFRSSDDRVEVAYAAGVDEVLLPDVVEAVERTLSVVGRDLGQIPDHPIRVELLPDSEALSKLTGLSLEAIQTSGTIAVCKWNRLMLTSPRAALMGYGYLDTASHELIHLLVSQRTWNHTPIWLHEAIAKHEESRWREGEPLYRPGLTPREESRLSRAARTQALITFEQMHPSMALLPSAEAAELAFSEVYTVTAFLLSRGGYPKLGELLDALAGGAEDMAAIRAVYGFTRERFVRAWLEYLRAERFEELSGDEALEAPGPARKPGQNAGERRLLATRRLELRDHYHLGQLLRARGRTAASAVQYLKARELAGSRHAALWVVADKLGLALLELDRKGEARAAFEESLRLHPEGLEAHLYLGQVLLAEDPEAAFLHGREAVRQNPLDPRVHHLLFEAARALQKKGDADGRWAAAAARHEAALRVLGLALRETDEGGEAAPRPAAAARADAPPTTARLRVLSQPWARVWLDLQDTGLTTPVLELAVTPGRHWVALVADCSAGQGGKAVELVDARAGELSVIDRRLCAPPGP